uniref:Gustatory receptor n=1 Tax=Anopheles albimanus TaxID=7167 RepID=A0A182FR55_ANOAL
MRYAEMEEFVNQAVFKVFGMRPIFEIQSSSFWKPLINVCYQMILLGLLLALQFIIYRMHLDQDFAGWFTSISSLLTCVVILTQSLVSSRPLAHLLQELREIEFIVRTTFSTSKASQSGSLARYSRTFYALYAIGLLRGFFRTFLMIQLNVRSFWLALLLLAPALFILVRITQQVQLTELIGTWLGCIADELSLLTGSANIGALVQPNSSADAASGGHKIFRQRCHSVADIERALLQPYHCLDSAALQDQINHWIVRLQLHRFEFTANGLYTIDYGLFCSMLAASATYIVIMYQFDKKSPEVAE